MVTFLGKQLLFFDFILIKKVNILFFRLEI